MAKPKPEPTAGPDLGYYPMMHPYPGFRACAGCGGLLAWDAPTQQRVSAVFGNEHCCEDYSVRRPQ